MGFGSHRGTVIAGREWDAPQESMHVPPGRPDSWEDVLHRAEDGDRLLLFGQANQTTELLRRRGHRAIGVVYHPEYEALGNYVPTVLPRCYDAFLYIEESQALHPLGGLPGGNEGEGPGNLPFGRVGASPCGSRPGS